MTSLETKSSKKDSRLSFSRYFNISKDYLKKEDFFDISLISDLPLFIDPFHLFYSNKNEYKKLHDEIIRYLSFLREYSIKLNGKKLSNADIDTYFRFPEIKQNWFGYSYFGNGGRGLGKDFANALNENFFKLFKTGTPGHIEKLTLVADGVGKDTISDFTTNLIHSYLAELTQEFAKKYIAKEYLGKFTIKKAKFDYDTRCWIHKEFILPKFENDYVILTPKDLLTKERPWINKEDFIKDFNEIPYATSNVSLREQIINYFNQKMKDYSEVRENKKTGKVRMVKTAKTKRLAVRETVSEFPETIDIYIEKKEKSGGDAIKQSIKHVSEIEEFKDNKYHHFIDNIDPGKNIPTTLDEARTRANYFKECVEKELYIDFYDKEGNPAPEEWIQRQFLYVWGGSPSDVNRESKRGRARVDYVISKGSEDKCLVEFKLASSKTLESNLKKQLDKYKDIFNAQYGLWIVIVFKDEEYEKTRSLIQKLKINEDNFIIVDVRKNNKIQPSKLK